MPTHDVSASARGADLSGRPRLLAIGIPLLLLVLLGLPALVLPAGRDQAIFAVVGRVIASGGMPYVDAFDFKPPGVHLVYALASLGGGDPIVGAHALELLGVGVAAFALFRLTEPEGLVAACTAASLLIAGYLGTLRYWDLAQPEGFALPLVMGSLLVFRGARARPTPALLAGALLGAASLMKYPVVLFAALFPLLSPVPERTRAADAGVLDVEPLPEHPHRRYAWAALGVALVAAIAASWLALGGALGAFVSIQTDYVPGYTKLTTLDGLPRAIAASFGITRAFFDARPLLFWPPLLGLVAAVTTRPRRRFAAPATGVLVALAGVVVQGKFFHYHFIPMLPFLAWMSGLGVAAILERLRPGRESRAVAGLVVLGLCAALAISFRAVAADRWPAIERLTGTRDRDAFRGSAAFGALGTGDHSLLATTRVTEEVRRLSRPGDTLFVWGFEPLIYLESELVPASRFIYTAAFISPWCPEAWSEEMVRDLTTDPPAIIVVASRDAIPWVTGVPLDSRGALARYPAIVALLRSRYTLAGQVERFTVFTRAALQSSVAREARAAS